MKRASASNADALAFYSASTIDWKTPDNVVPSRVTVAIIAKAIKDTINAYSTALAPFSLFSKLIKYVYISLTPALYIPFRILLTHLLVTEPKKRTFS